MRNIDKVRNLDRVGKADRVANADIVGNTDKVRNIDRVGELYLYFSRERYGVAMISRLLKIVGLLCKKAL